jgi:uncharacterized membrane protein
LFSSEGWNTVLRTAHILAGITWIGLLYFFNLVQVPGYAAFGDEAKARNIAIDKVTRRALWWFRWAAVTTFVFGILLTTEKGFWDNSKSGKTILISAAMLLGTIMLLNVWGVIWRNQKVVLANAANVLAGGEANPAAPAAGRRAVMASRQNFIFSFSMLYGMVFSAHDVYTGSNDPNLTSGKIGAFWAILLVIVAVLEVNALGLMPWKTEANKGLNKLYDGKGVKNPIISATGLLVITVVLSQLLLK